MNDDVSPQPPCQRRAGINVAALPHAMLDGKSVAEALGFVHASTLNFNHRSEKYHRMENALQLIQEDHAIKLLIDEWWALVAAGSTGRRGTSVNCEDFLLMCKKTYKAIGKNGTLLQPSSAKAQATAEADWVANSDRDNMSERTFRHVMAEQAVTWVGSTDIAPCRSMLAAVLDTVAVRQFDVASSRNVAEKKFAPLDDRGLPVLLGGEGAWLGPMDFITIAGTESLIGMLSSERATCCGISGGVAAIFTLPALRHLIELLLPKEVRQVVTGLDALAERELVMSGLDSKEDSHGRTWFGERRALLWQQYEMGSAVDSNSGAGHGSCHPVDMLQADATDCH